MAAALALPEAQAQTAPLHRSPRLKPAASDEAARRSAPLYLRADQLSGQPGGELRAEGDVEMRQAGVVLRADQLQYEQARGSPAAGPTASTSWTAPDRAPTTPSTPVARATARRASRTGCCAPRSVELDFDRQRRHRRRRGAALPGRAHPGAAGAELPAERRPQVGLVAAHHGLDNRSGLSWACPTTGTSRPTAMPPGADAASPGAAWRWTRVPLPGARLRRPVQPTCCRTTAWPAHALAWGFEHEGSWVVRPATAPIWPGSRTTPGGRTFRSNRGSHARAMLPVARGCSRTAAFRRWGRGLAYARVQHWQVLQAGTDHRSWRPTSAAAAGRAAGGCCPAACAYALEAESTASPATSAGRHAAAHRLALARAGRDQPALRAPGWWLTPKLSLNAASYSFDQPMARLHAAAIDA
jgi:LPS-assembly protein